MVGPSPKPRSPINALSAAIRAVREQRGLTTTQLAAMMNMTRRSYERFENGRTPARFDRIHQFAAVTDSDYLAIVTAAEINQSLVASGAANNKLVRVQASSLKRFTDKAGDRVLELDPLTILAAADKMYAELELHLKKRREFLDALIFPNDGVDDEDAP